MYLLRADACDEWRLDTEEGMSTSDGYEMCPACGHHTSAYSGSCTVIIPETLTYCGCDCRVEMGGPSLADIVRRLHQ